MPYLHPKNTPFALMFIVRSHTASSVDTASSSSAVHDAGVVEQDVQRAELALGRGDHALAVLRTRDVGLHGDRAAACGPRPRRPCRCAAASSMSTATIARAFRRPTAAPIRGRCRCRRR